MAATTTSSQTAPASARTMLPSTLNVVGGQPDYGQIGQRVGDHQIRAAGQHQQRPAFSASRCRNVATTCSVLVQVMTRDATGPTRNVVSGANGTVSSMRAPAKTVPTPPPSSPVSWVLTVA